MITSTLNDIFISSLSVFSSSFFLPCFLYKVKNNEAKISMLIMVVTVGFWYITELRKLLSSSYFQIFFLLKWQFDIKSLCFILFTNNIYKIKLTSLRICNSKRIWYTIILLSKRCCVYIFVIIFLWVEVLGKKKGKSL